MLLRSFSSFYVTSVLFAQEKPKFLWTSLLQFSVKTAILKHTVFLYLFLCFFVWMCIQRETTWFCCDSSFHFCPTRLQRCPTILLGYSFLLLSVMQIFQQQYSFLVTAPVSCRKPAIIFLPCSFLGFLSLFSFLSSTVYLLYKYIIFEKKKNGPTNFVKMLNLI